MEHYVGTFVHAVVRIELRADGTGVIGTADPGDSEQPDTYAIRQWKPISSGITLNVETGKNEEPDGATLGGDFFGDTLLLRYEDSPDEWILVLVREDVWHQSQKRLTELMETTSQ